MERGAMAKGGEDGKGATGRGERGWDGEGEKKGQKEGRFYRWDGMMGCLGGHRL